MKAKKYLTALIINVVFCTQSVIMGWAFNAAFQGGLTVAFLAILLEENREKVGEKTKE